MLTYDDIPREFNLASHFVDRNVLAGHGDRIALIADEGDCTYVQLAERVNRAANALLGLGVRAEERVLLALSDGIDMVSVWYGVLKIGAVTAEAYTFLAPKDFAYLLNYTRARVVAADAATLPALREIREGSRWLETLLVTGVPSDRLEDGEVALDDALAAASPECEVAPTTPDDIALWKFTTGSTGQPKAAVHSHHAPLLSHECYARGVLDIQPDDRVLAVPKLFFGYARDLVALYPFGVAAAGIVFPERSTPDRLFELIERHRPTILVQVPTMMRQMVAHSGRRPDLSSVRLCTSAGEALPEDLYRAWRDAFGVEVLDGIGSAEAYHIYASNRPGDVRPGSVGRPVPGYRARVVDEQGEELPAGEVGELWVEGGTAALMYWNDRPRSKATYAGDLVRTGDLFREDDDGYLWYQGRADDMIKVGGIWVAPREVEACLREHDAVFDCGVTGQLVDGLMTTCAFVVMVEHPAADDSELAAELQDHVRRRLSGHKYPRKVVFLAELPKTASGKVNRRGLTLEQD